MKLRKMKNLIFRWLLCIAIILIAINLPSFTVTAHANEEYNFDDKDVLLFSGTGELTEYEVYTQTQKNENRGKKIAKIEGYSSIGVSAFEAQEFEIVIIGDSVNVIRDAAFADIRSNKYIVLPNSLTDVGTRAFYGAGWIVYSGLADANYWFSKRCDKIVDGFCLSSDGRLLSGYVGDSTSITIPSGVAEIADNAFLQSDLTEIVIPAYVQFLGDGLFEECNNLACVKFEDISNLSWNINPFTNTPNDVYFDIEKADEVSKIESLYDSILRDTDCRVRVHPMYYDEVSKTCNVDKLPLPEPLPEKLFEYDADSDMFVLTVNDENKDAIAAYKDIRILANHKLIIDTDLVITGDLVVDFFGAITVNKGCSIRAFYVDLSDIVSVKLGDKNCLAGLGIATDDVKVKHTGSSALYDMDPDDIDDTEFMKENGLLVYKDGPDCGINMNSDGTCVSEDRETKYGDVYYEVYTNPDDTVPAYTGTLEEDWASVDMDPAKFKAGSRIDFTVKAYNGKVLQTNGVRFPDNKTYISTREEEVKADTAEGCKCSYVLPKDPDRYLGVTVHFVDPDELLTDATFAWSYDERVQQYDFDTYVSHGVIEVVSAYNDGEPLFNSHKPDTSPYWSEPGENVSMRDEEGHKWYENQGRFPIGTELIVRLIPDRGYQLTKFTISNIESSTTAVDGVNEYTFNLARPDYYHLCAVFTPVEDKVDILTASGITGGSVTFDDTEVDNGTMVLNVSDATPDAEEKSAFEAMADNKGYEVAKCLNLESEQRFYKGVENATREQCWIVEKSELDSPADITLECSGLKSEDVVVLHNHNGVYEELPATYENGQLSFSSQSFSDFAIATKKTGGSGDRCNHPEDKIELKHNKLPECETAGEDSRVCSNCGEIVEAGIVVPALGHDYHDGICTREGCGVVSFELCNDISVSAESILYDGSTHVPTVTVSYKGETLTKDTDYKLTVESKTEVGEYELTVTGINKYRDSIRKKWSIVPPQRGLWCADIPDQVYTGTAIKPEIEVYNNGIKLVAGKDYTISYKNNIKVAAKDAVNTNKVSIAPSVTITGKGNYADKKTVNFAIVKCSINTAAVDCITVAKTGRDIKITPVVTLDGKKLKAGTDYVVSTSENENDAVLSYKEAGCYNLYAVGKGNYTGSVQFKFTVTESILASKVNIEKIADMPYTGSEVKPNVKITYKTKTNDVTDKFDITFDNNTQIGTAAVIIKAKDGSGFIGEKRATFKITGRKITDIKLGRDGKTKLPAFTYSGSENKPDWTSVLYYKTEAEPLKENIDFTVSYIKNVNAGTATAVVTGINGYTGTKKLTFKINKYDASKDEKDIIKINNGEAITVTYEKGGVTVKPVVSMNGILLTEKVDYTLRYANNKAVAKSDAVNNRGKSVAPTVNVVFKGNFSGKKSAVFNIAAKDISTLSIIMADKGVSTRANSWKQTAATITDTNGKKLVAGTDYEKVFKYYRDAECKNEITDATLSAGTTVYAKVTGINNYAGSEITGSYRVSTTSISSVAASISDKEYTGSEICPSAEEITVSFGKGAAKKSLIPGSDYEVVPGSYTKNVNKGTASVTIRGIGDYYGTKVVKFKIVVKKISWWK